MPPRNYPKLEWGAFLHKRSGCLRNTKRFVRAVVMHTLGLRNSPAMSPEWLHEDSGALWAMCTAFADNFHRLLHNSSFTPRMANFLHLYFPRVRFGNSIIFKAISCCALLRQAESSQELPMTHTEKAAENLRYVFQHASRYTNVSPPIRLHGPHARNKPAGNHFNRPVFALHPTVAVETWYSLKLLGYARLAQLYGQVDTLLLTLLAAASGWLVLRRMLTDTLVLTIAGIRGHYFPCWRCPGPAYDAVECSRSGPHSRFQRRTVVGIRE
jgi:hypothetical protein